MKKCRKLLSILMALTLFVSLVLPAGIIPATAAANDLIAYVNTTSGNNDTAKIGDSSLPYATIAAAVTAVDAMTTDGERVVQFVGASSESLPAHTNMITIRGVNTTDSTITVRDFSINGPTKLENFDLTTGEAIINTNYHELILGEGFTASRWAYVMTGNRGGGSSSANNPEKITVNGGDVYWLYVGSPNSQSAAYNRCDGLDYVFNSGNMIGAAIGYQGAVDLRGNVNITLNKPLYSHNYSGIYLYQKTNPNKFNGNALQLIYNNNSKNGNATKSGSLYPTVESIAALGGKFYELVVAKNNLGSTLSATEVAGTYRINNGGNYVAIAYDAEGNEVARSNEQGYLTVGAAGAYTVGWELTGDVYAYVDATNGNDETAKVGNSALPYATMSAAISALDALSGNINRIVQINSATCAFSTVNHTNMITVRGAAEDGSTTVTGSGSTNGPLTFTNVKKTPETSYIITNGSDIVFEKDATSDYLHLYSGSRWSSAASSATGLAQTNVIIKNGSFLATYLGNAETSASGYRNHGGVNYVFEGGSVIRVMIPGGGKNSFLGDVNITLNKQLENWHGDRGVYLGTPDEAYPTKFNGNALQLIYNNGSKDASATYSGDQYPTVESVAAMGGVLYELVVQKNDFGLTLSTTETAGTYAVNCDAAVGTFLPVVYDANGAVVEGATYDEQAKLLTVPAAGNYVVKVEDLNPVVSEIDFSTGSQWTFGFYTGAVATEETPYVMSFDYYLPAGSGKIKLDNVGDHASVFEGSTDFKPGHHKMVTKWKTVTGNNYFVPRVICEDTNTTLYIWNYSVTIGGANGTNNGSISSDWRNATYTNDTRLFAYDWYPTMDDSIPVSMEILSNPTKTEYEIGDALELAGLTLSVTDNLGETKTITEGFEVSGFDPETAGEQTVTVTYMGLTATFTVLVSEPTLTGDGIAYVDIANGNDETAKIGFSDRPFATIAAAVTAIDAIETDGERIVQFVGASDAELPEHTNMITIRGVNTTDSTITIRNFGIHGPTKLENFDLTTNEAYINTNYHELILGEGFTASRWAYVMTGGRWGGSSASKGTEKITVNDGDVYWLYVGSPNRDSNNNYQDAEYNRCDGLDYVFNDGSMIGAAIGYHGAVDIRGNVNITMSKPLHTNSYSGIYLYSSMGGKYTKFNGNALQLIYNNNSKNDNATKSGSNYPTVESIASIGGVFYEVVVEKNDLGSTLSATETAGTYKLNNNGELIAIAYDADGKQVARSKDGYLTVEEAGSYTVVWAEETIEYASTLYVSESGTDSKQTLGTQDDPFLTINAAITALNTVSADNKTIYILDKASLPEELTANVGEITITGAAEAQLLMANDVVLNGDVVFGGVMQDHTAGSPQFSFRANGHNISFRGDMQQTASYPKIPEVFLGKTNTNLGKITMTIDDAAFNRIFTGAYYNTKDVTIDGLDLFFNGGSSYALNIGANGWSGAPGTTTYTDNVNLVFSGGFVRNNLIQILNVATQNRYTTFADGAALQVIFNDGKGTTMMVVDSNDTSTPYVADNFYRIECAADVFLTPTAVAGEYTVDVPAGQYAIAKKNGKIIGYAADGETLKVEGAGTYKVEYTDNVNFFLSEDTESGEVTLTVNEDFTMDFETFEILEREGYIFNGWMDEDGNVLTDPNLTAGTVIKANYVAKDERFYMAGTQIREPKNGKEQAMRFIVHLGKDFGVNVLERGTLVIPNTILGVKELVIGGTYSYNGNTYAAQTVVGEKLWLSTDGYMRYTAALTGITNYMTAYAVRGYIKYVDMNGVERTEYTDNTTAASMNEVAEQLLELDPDYAPAKAIVEAAKAAVEQKYAGTTQPLNKYMFNTPDSGYTTLNSNISNGKYVTSQGTTISFDKLDGKLSPLVIGVDIDAVGENSNVDATTIMQLSDLHFTYCDEDDFAENNPLTMASWEHRQNNGTWFTTDMDFSSTPLKWVQNTLEYAAAVGDQTVITGDIIDFLSYGNLKLMNRVIAEPYSNSLMVVGNHEPVRLVADYGVGADDRFCKEYYEMLEKNWANHDLSYTSKMVGKEVMVIQMDNANYYFTQDQIDKLTADLAIARENGYTVLIFTHIPFVPTDGATSQELLMGTLGFEDGLVESINSNIELIDGRDADWSADGKSSFTPKEYVSTTEAMYNLIVSNGDIIKGVFNGHQHKTIYSKLYKDGGVVIPQYTLGTSFVEGGVTLKINVK